MVIRASLLFFGLVLVCGGCASEQTRPSQAPETPLVGSPPTERKTSAATTPADPETTAAVEEEVRVELVMLEEGNPYESDTGVTISLTGTDPAVVSMSRDGSEETFELPADMTYAEGSAFGSVWSASRVGGLHLELRHDSMPPFTAEEAAGLAGRELEANLGCTGELQRLDDSPPGTLTFSRDAEETQVPCRVVIGLYTRRVIE